MLKHQREVPEASLEKRMNEALQRVGLFGWEVAWVPDPDMPKRGEVKLADKVIMIYETDHTRAWETFVHEALEVKRRPSERPLRLLVKALVEVIEEISYREKEDYLDNLPGLLAALDELEAST